MNTKKDSIQKYEEENARKEFQSIRNKEKLYHNLSLLKPKYLVICLMD